jgi:hypothetical protein
MTPEAIDYRRSVLFAQNVAPTPNVAPPSESTTTFALPTEEARILRISRPRSEHHCHFSFDVACSIARDPPWMIAGRNLIEQACLNAFSYEGKGTAAPKAIQLYWPTEEPGSIEPRPTPAQKLIEDIRIISRLTLEEIAPLAGVSRRSLQHWRAGGVISARKEQRLRDLGDTLGMLGQNDAVEVRRRLFERTSHGVRPYDLLAEGRFDAAYLLLTGREATIDIAARNQLPSLPLAPELIARMSIRDGGPVGTSGRVDLSRSRSLKR